VAFTLKGGYIEHTPGQDLCGAGNSYKKGITACSMQTIPAKGAVSRVDTTKKRIFPASKGFQRQRRQITSAPKGASE